MRNFWKHFLNFFPIEKRQQPERCGMILPQIKSRKYSIHLKNRNMRMSWSKKTSSSAISNENAGIKDWRENVGIRFENQTNSFLELLADFPEIGTEVNRDKKIRGFQLTKQTRIYHRIKQDKILILAFFDVRQNPKKLKF